MSTGKYSPTVWSLASWEDRCVNVGDIYDVEGFDMYGYNAEDKDRAGKTEFDYQQEALREELDMEDLL